MKKIVLIVISIIAILILAGTALLVVSKVISQGAPGDQVKVVKVGPLFESDDLDFTVNVYGSTKRFIKAKVAFEVNNEKVIGELNSKMPLVKDQIITVLSMQELEELATIAGKEDCKLAIMDALNTFLEKGQIIQVYFTDLMFS